MDAAETTQIIDQSGFENSALDEEVVPYPRTERGARKPKCARCRKMSKLREIK